MKKYSFLMAVVFSMLLSSAQAQHRFENPVSMGMGATGTTFIGDYNANFINPANLMLPDRKNGTVFSFFQLGAGAGGPLADINTYNKYLTDGRLLDSATQKSMLDAWVGSENSSGKLHYARLNVSFVPAALSVRTSKQAFSAAIRVRTMGNIGVSRGSLEAGFGGLSSELFSEAKEANFSFTNFTFSELSFGYARTIYKTERGPILELPFTLYAGIAPKILLGMSATEFNVNSDLRVRGDSLIVHNFDYEFNTFGEVSGQLTDYLNDRAIMDELPELSDYLSAPKDVAGINASGFGLDMGLTAEMDFPRNTFQGSFFGSGRQFLRVSVSLTDIGKLNFKEDAASFRNSGTLEWRGADIDQDRLNQEFDSNLGDYFSFVLEDSIGTDLYLNFSKEERSAISGSLPSMFNVGFQLTAGKMTAAMDIAQGLNNSGINSESWSIGMGFEYRAFNFWPIRAGFNTGGDNSASWTTGTGLMTKNFDFNVGLMFVGNSQSSGTWVALGVSAFTFRF